MFKPQFKSWAFVLIFFIIYCIIFKNVYMITMMISVLGLVSCFSSFSYDKQYRCDEYLAAMPVSRKQLVWSKYIFVLCLDLILAAAAFVLAAGYAVWAGEPLVELLAGVGSALVVTVLMQAILLPMVYIIGIDKARYVNIVIWMVPWVVIMLFRDRLPQIQKEQIIMMLKIIPVIAVVLMVVSV